MAADVRAIAALPGDVVREAAPGVDGAVRLKAGSGSMPGSVLGTAPALARLLADAGGR